MAADPLLDILLLASILALGAVAAFLLLGEWASLRTAALAFPLGGGLLSWTVFLVSWAGLRMDGVNLSLLLALLGVSAVGLLWARRRRSRPAPAQPDRGSSERSPRIFVWLIVAVGLALVGASLLIAVWTSYFLWDSIAIWALQGYGIAHAGSILGAEVGAHGLAYPMNIPLQVALFTVAGGDVLPGSKVIFPLFYLSLLLGFFDFSRRHGMTTAKAGLATLALATIPALFTESTSGYANAPMAVYLSLGGMLLLDGALSSSRAELLTGGLLLGLAGWTRVEGVLYAGAVALGCLAVAAAARRPRRRWAWSLVPIVVLLVPWFVFYRLEGPTGSQFGRALAAALEAVRAGQLHLGALRVVLLHTAASLRDTASWGWVWPLIVVVAALCVRRARRAGRIGFSAFAAMGVGTALVTILIFYLGSFGVADLRGWLVRSFDRAYLITPLLLLMGTLQLLVPSSPPSSATDRGRQAVA